MLTKSLIKVGDGYAVVLDRELMDLVGISPDVPVNLQVNGQTLTLSSSIAAPNPDLAIDSVLARHEEALRRRSR
jgi:hypothetical protein